jgi:murein DD-endopeptidase MepM/ murein hydrolase activator NlpD
MPTADRTHTTLTRRRFHRRGGFDRGDLEVAPWVPSRPPPPPRPATRPPPPPRRSPLRSVAASLGLGVVVTAALTLAGGLPLTSISGHGGHARGVAAAAAPGELPGSQAITSASGPVHPVRVDGPIDYGDAEARFGASRYGHVHEGQDMFGRPGTPLVAVRDAAVIDRGDDGGRGNYVAIYSEAEDQTYVYMHMLNPSPLRPGDHVAAGQEVGGMGCTGSCWGTHLHFEVRLGRGIERKPVDPLPMLKRWPQVPE